jgi:hypothetical protein
VVFNTSTLAHQGRRGASTPSGPLLRRILIIDEL